MFLAQKAQPACRIIPICNLVHIQNITSFTLCSIVRDTSLEIEYRLRVICQDDLVLRIRFDKGATNSMQLVLDSKHPLGAVEARMQCVQRIGRSAFFLARTHIISKASSSSTLTNSPRPVMLVKVPPDSIVPLRILLGL